MFDWVYDKVSQYLLPKAVSAAAVVFPATLKMAVSSDKATAAVTAVRDVAGETVASVSTTIIGKDPLQVVSDVKREAENRIADVVLERAKEQYLTPIIVVIALLITFIVVKTRRSR